MKNILLPLIVTTGLLLSACNLTVLSGSGKIINTSRPVSGFTRLTFDAPGELTITQNGKEALSIEGDDNLLEHIKSEVINGALHIYVEPEDVIIKASKPIHYSLSIKTLDQVSLNGSGSITVADFKGKAFALKLNGSGSIRFSDLQATTLDFGMNGSGDVSVTHLSADTLQTTVNGSGKFSLQGKATRQNVSILGSGKYEARNLESAQAEISVSGSGESQVWVTETMSVSILGSGSVGYLGKPRMTQQIAGSGNIYSLQ